jgi:hypothetical protein
MVYVTASVYVCALFAYREGDPKGWSTVLVTALGSWGNMVPRGHLF